MNEQILYNISLLRFARGELRRPQVLDMVDKAKVEICNADVELEQLKR